MRRILIALLVLLFALTGRGEAGSTNLSVEIKNQSVVLGEPVIIEVKMESTGVFNLAREFGPCDGGLLRIAVKNTSGIKTSTATDLPPCPSVLPPPSDVPVVYPSYQDQANFTYKYWLMPGDYEVQASYHSENNTRNETAPFWTGMLSSNSVRCHVDYPKGDDLQALLALGIDPSKETSPNIYVSVIRDHSKELLNKFPTSTYAGYVLVKKIPDYSNPLFKPVPPQEQVRMAREEGRTVAVFPDKRFEEYFQQLDRYVKGGNVPDRLKPLIYGFYGDLLVQRGRFGESVHAFRCALEGDCPPGGKEKVFHDRAKAFLEVLIESNKVETVPKKAETESVR